jgi:serine/alanine adding enzyme
MSISWEINSIEIPKSLIQDFLDNHPDSSFFQSESFIELYRKNNYQPLNIVGILDNKVVSYCNVLVLKENYGIISGLTSRAIIWGGPLALDNFLFEQTLIELKNILNKKAIYLQIRNLTNQTSQQKKILLKNGFEYHEHFTVINSLNSDLMSGYHSGRRKNIRRALKSGLNFKLLTQENEVEKAGDFIVQTYKELKLPCPSIDFFKDAVFFEAIKIFGVFQDSRMISCRFCLTQKNILYDWYAGSDKLSSNLYPNDFIVHKILEWGYENGYRIFDFGGAGNNKAEYGVRDFKLKFGGELVEFGRNEIVFQSFKFKIGKLGFQILKKFRK